MWTPLSKQDNLMNDVFKIMLDLEEPWKLVNIEHDPKEETWHLFIDFERGALFPCPHCGTPCKAYDAEKAVAHANIRITLDTYSHLLPNMQRDAAQNFDKLMLVGDSLAEAVN